MSIADDVRWSDLETKGFIHFPAFLTPAQLDACRIDYAGKPRNLTNLNYDVPGASLHGVAHLEEAVTALLLGVHAHTNVRVDCAVGASYFATKRGVAFGWHQDHE